MTTTTDTSKVITPSVAQRGASSQQCTTPYDYVLQVGSRRFGVGVSFSPAGWLDPWEVYLFRLPTVVGLRSFPETVEHASIGDVIDLGWMGEWRLAEERVPGGRMQDRQVTLVQMSYRPAREENNFWEETE